VPTGRSANRYPSIRIGQPAAQGTREQLAPETFWTQGREGQETSAEKLRQFHHLARDTGFEPVAFGSGGRPRNPGRRASSLRNAGRSRGCAALECTRVHRGLRVSTRFWTRFGHSFRLEASALATRAAQDRVPTPVSTAGSRHATGLCPVAASLPSRRSLFCGGLRPSNHRLDQCRNGRHSGRRQ
jgi:hypothetical protein